MSTGMQVSRRRATRSPRTVKEKSLPALLENLYSTQLALDPDDAYLREHAKAICIANQIRTFHWYRPFLPTAGNVLDWGCNHAPDSCLLRAWFGDQLNLYSCDFAERNRYPVFQAFAGASYTNLEAEVQLPFPENHFDAIIGSGVLEHAATDYESLKELRRVLKPEGVLVLSYLPNWLSLNEWMRRVVRQRAFHRRLYGLGEAKQLLKRCGFYPVAAGYHTFFWERLLTAVGLRRWERGLAKVLSRLLPVQTFCSTLCFVARKVNVM